MRLPQLILMQLTLVALFTCCAANRKPDLLAFAQRIQVGMPRSSVEALLGKPVFDEELRVPYGKRVKYKEFESPYTPCQLTVYYENDLVRNVQYFEGFGKSDRFWELATAEHK